MSHTAVQPPCVKMWEQKSVWADGWIRVPHACCACTCSKHTGTAAYLGHHCSSSSFADAYSENHLIFKWVGGVGPADTAKRSFPLVGAWSWPARWYQAV